MANNPKVSRYADDAGEYITIATLCDTCAFRPGTEANRDTYTQSKVEMCLTASQSFDCHEAKGPNGGPVICRGFAETIRRRIDSGEQSKVPDWKQKIAAGWLQELAVFEAAHDLGEEYPILDRIVEVVENAKD